MRWCMPVIPATLEKGESLEPGRRWLLWAKIAPLHSSLGSSQTKKTHKDLVYLTLMKNKVDFLKTLF